MPSRQPRLEGLEIALTGKLAAMTREEIQARIAAAGATIVEEPRETTHLLVVGSHGWALRRDGRITKNLEMARELEQRGVAIRIVDEATFLVEAGFPERAEDLANLYTIEQLARVLQVPIEKLRSWRQRKLIRPVREIRSLCWFDFGEVLSARALVQLLDSGAQLHEIRRSLERMRGWMPGASRALTQLAAASDHGSLQIRLENGRLAEPSGQLLLPFDPPPNDDKPAGILAHRPAPTAENWFDRGVAAESDGRYEEAADFYQQCLLVGGPRAEAAFNLGNCLHALSRPGEAAQRYMNAVEIDPSFVEAWNNLGNALAELSRFDPAVNAYRRAIGLVPEYADAHFNLAETLHQLARFDEARRHWEIYLERAPHTSDRAFVRRRIQECEAAIRGRAKHPLREVEKQREGG